ncbi:hypothetical protein FN846DRAFT_266956 [Sphaerosporella brunnea]|uniref:Uncharacterized protein n=1 Tax=Sphaerosporella brunnea TaxID=1250544 RepID=A0A5J5EMW9_9PEZI|nr:hypothetical protein FN846DRAFT_266956 [Sphaerosporella brunnea]
MVNQRETRHVEGLPGMLLNGLSVRITEIVRGSKELLPLLNYLAVVFFFLVFFFFFFFSSGLRFGMREFSCVLCTFSVCFCFLFCVSGMVRFGFGMVRCWVVQLLHNAMMRVIRTARQPLEWQITQDLPQHICPST